MRSPPLTFPATLRDLLRSRRPHVIVTGAGGWLGQATLEMLDDAFGDDFVDQVTAFANSERLYVLRSGRSIHIAPLVRLSTFPALDHPLLVAHFAFLTREHVGAYGLQPYVAVNRRLTELVLGQVRRLKAAGTFSTSSGAVYRRDRSLDRRIEDNPYGCLKLEEEDGFAALHNFQNVRTAICRVFNLAGPFVNKDFALNNFISAVLAEEPIRIQAHHPVYRSFAHVQDVVTSGFAIMLGLCARQDTYDTAGEVLEVGELAEHIKRVLDAPEISIIRPPVSGDEDRYAGDGQIFRELINGTGRALATLDEQILDTAAYLWASSSRAKPFI